VISPGFGLYVDTGRTNLSLELSRLRAPRGEYTGHNSG
jgi:hypothetical protein